MRILQKKIAEKYGNTYEDLLDNEPFYEELRGVIREVAKGWKLEEYA